MILQIAVWVEHEKKKFQIPLRTPQRPQPVFDPNMVCVHFTYCYHKFTHLTHTRTHFIYIQINLQDILYYCTTVNNLYRSTSVYTIRINETHNTHGHCTLYIQIHLQIYWSTVHNLYTAIQLDAAYAHLWCTHYARISCTAVFYTVDQSMYTCTLEPVNLY